MDRLSLTEGASDLAYGLYDSDKCRRCGTCLASCPRIEPLSPDEGARLVARLAGGEWVAGVLERCTGCMSCDAACPNGAHPYGLLLERFGERYLDSGIPRVFCNAMPQRDGPNIWRGLDRWLSRREKENLEAWARPPAGDEVLFLGRNQRLTPYVARFGDLGIRKVIAFCPACQNTIVNLAPRALGIEFDVEVTGLVDWIDARISSGGITPLRKLAGSVTVQDPCHAAFLGEESVEKARALVGLLGLEIIEMERCGVAADCCGLGASLGRYSMLDVVRTGLRRSVAARRTGADMTCAWCNGCYMTMNMFRMVYPLAPPVYHLVELVQLSTGERPQRKVPARGAQLLAAAVEATAVGRIYPDHTCR